MAFSVLKKDSPEAKVNFESHKSWSIMNTVMASCWCQLPVLFCSIPALVFSFQVFENLKRGDQTAAATSSRNALIMNQIASVGLICCVLVFICFFLNVYSDVHVEIKRDSSNITS